MKDQDPGGGQIGKRRTIRPDELWNAMAERAASNCRLRTGGDMDVDMIFLDKEGDVLGSSAGAADLIRKVDKGVDRE